MPSGGSQANVEIEMDDETENAYLEELASGHAVEESQKALARRPVPVAEPPAVPSEAEVKQHRLTHIPFAAWCSACVKTRSRGDKHGTRKEVDRTPVVQVDFFFTSVDPDGRPKDTEAEEHTCSMVGIDVDTRMILAVPGPNKGGGALKRYVEELVRFTISLHNEAAIIIQSDGEPAIKAVVRATTDARARLGKRTTQRTTPVGDHQANGAAERAVQTVRRLGNTLVEAVEEIHGKLPVGADLRVWAQAHAAFLYNRFHVCPHMQLTPFEAAFGGKPFDGKLCIFGETVYGKAITPYKGGAQWILGIWVGANTSNGSHHILTEKGAVEAAAVRRSSEQHPPTKFGGLPWMSLSAVVRPRKVKKLGPEPIAFPVVDSAPAEPTAPMPREALAPPRDEEAEAVEQAAKQLEATSQRSDSSDELIAGEMAPSPASRRMRPGPSSPAAAAASAELGASHKRKAEDEPNNAPAQESESSHATGTKRTQEEADLDAEPMTIRIVETVDAEWFAADGEDEDEVQEDRSNHEEPYATTSKRLETGNADTPPDIDAQTLQDMDELAEIEEIERLVKMGVLLEPVNGEDADLLTTTFATAWKSDKSTWWRRARLVARQYRWANDMDPEDTFSPASMGSLLRHVPVLSQAWGTPLWICDVKDAYLNVPQPEDEPVVVDAPLSYVKRYGPKRWKLGRILPGQRRGAQEWFLHLNVDLEAQKMESMVEVPTLYRAMAPEERKAIQVHVDDAMLTGDAHLVDPLLEELGKRYTIKVSGPFGPGDEFEFLKRRFRIEADGSITVRAAAHFYIDIHNLLGQPRLRQTPGPAGELFVADESAPLSANQATLYRRVVGKLLYIAGERPDIQVVIQYLASKASAPTEGAMRVLKHLAGFMKQTEGHGVNLKMAKGATIMEFEPHEPRSSHLVEAVSDSNFANDRTTRKSLSSGHIYINKCLVFSFVRSQKVVTLSSGEAELVALTQTVGESILMHKAWEFLVREQTLHLARSDSSVARAIASRLGVGRVKHLQTSCLWVQQWVHQKTLKVTSISTSRNPTDMGTKILSAGRLRMLCGITGMVNDSGERVGIDELQVELGKPKGWTPKMARMIQLLMAGALSGTLQGCSLDDEDYATKVGGYVLFFVNLVDTLYTESFLAMVIVFFLMAAILVYVFGITWTVEVRCGRGRSFTSRGLGPGYETQTEATEIESEPTETVTEQAATKPLQSPSSSDLPHGGQLRAVPDQLPGRDSGEQGDRARPTTTRVVETPVPLSFRYGHVSPNKLVYIAPAWGYSYHTRWCQSSRNSSKQRIEITVCQAIQRGLFPCQQCSGDDFMELKEVNPDYFDKLPKKKRR